MKSASPKDYFTISREPNLKVNIVTNAFLPHIFISQDWTRGQNIILHSIIRPYAGSEYIWLNLLLTIPASFRREINQSDQLQGISDCGIWRACYKIRANVPTPSEADQPNLN